MTPTPKPSGERQAVPFIVGGAVRSLTGRRGTLVSAEGNWIKVQWDNDDEKIYTFNARDNWIVPVLP